LKAQFWNIWKFWRCLKNTWRCRKKQFAFNN